MQNKRVMSAFLAGVIAVGASMAGVQSTYAAKNVYCTIMVDNTNLSYASLYLDLIDSDGKTIDTVKPSDISTTKAFKFELTSDSVDKITLVGEDGVKSSAYDLAYEVEKLEGDVTASLSMCGGIISASKNNNMIAVDKVSFSEMEEIDAMKTYFGRILAKDSKYAVMFNQETLNTFQNFLDVLNKSSDLSFTIKDGKAEMNDAMKEVYHAGKYDSVIDLPVSFVGYYTNRSYQNFPYNTDEYTEESVAELKDIADVLYSFYGENMPDLDSLLDVYNEFVAAENGLVKIEKKSNTGNINNTDNVANPNTLDASAVAIVVLAASILVAGFGAKKTLVRR